jgi:hypothetical protein
MKKVSRKALKFKNRQNEACEVLQNGNDYNLYVNGYYVKTIRAIKPYFILMSVQAFCDELIYEASLKNGLFIEV